MDDLVPFEPRPMWEQRQTERDHEYAWFSRYCELGPGRDLGKVARLCGVPVAVVRRAAAQYAWESRIGAYDAAVVQVQRAVVPDDAEALAMQYAVGIAMMRLGVKASQLKNPALIKLKDIIALMQHGSEMARRGAGVADLKIEKTVQARVESEFLDLLGD